MFERVRVAQENPLIPWNTMTKPISFYYQCYWSALQKTNPISSVTTLKGEAKAKMAEEYKHNSCQRFLPQSHPKVLEFIREE